MESIRYPVWIGEVAELHRDANIVLETPTQRCNFAAELAGRVDDLLDSRDQRRERGDDDPALGIGENLLVGLSDDSLGRSRAFRFDVDAVRNEQPDAAPLKLFELGVVGYAAIDRCFVELEVSGMDDRVRPAS